jgi:hypothetical protein
MLVRPRISVRFYGLSRVLRERRAEEEEVLGQMVKRGARAVFNAPAGHAAREPERRAGGGRAEGDCARAVRGVGIRQMREVRWMWPCASILWGADK